MKDETSKFFMGWAPYHDVLRTGRVNGPANPELTKRFNVTQYPTFIWKDGGDYIPVDLDEPLSENALIMWFNSRSAHRWGL